MNLTERVLAVVRRAAAGGDVSAQELLGTYGLPAALPVLTREARALLDAVEAARVNPRAGRPDTEPLDDALAAWEESEPEAPPE